MIRYVIFIFFCCSLFTAQAQQNNYNKAARQSTKAIDQLYQLDKEQKEAVMNIQQLHFERKAAIASLKTDNYRVYLHKLKSIREGTQYAIKKILHADQVPLFEAEQKRQQQEYARQIAKLKSEGTPKEKLDLAKITIE